MILNWFPEMQTVLGPVILVGPPTVALKKPLIVTFQHCASVKHGQWAITVHGSDTPYEEAPVWQVRLPPFYYKQLALQLID